MEQLGFSNVGIQRRKIQDKQLGAPSDNYHDFVTQ